MNTLKWCLNSFDFVFVHKGVRYTNNTEIKDIAFTETKNSHY